MTDKLNRGMMPPPPAQPQAPSPPPSAPALPPAAPPPPTKGVFQPKPPPTAPLRSEQMVRSVSDEMRRLLRAVTKELPGELSPSFSRRLTDHLVTYWRARRTLFRTIKMDNPWYETEEVYRDYVDVFARAEEAISTGSLSEVKEAAFDLEAESISFYAPALEGHELNLIEGLHHLSRALYFYEASFLTHDAVEQYVMLTSYNGARGAIIGTLTRFRDQPYPQAIAGYAVLLQQGIETQVANIIHGGVGVMPHIPTKPL